MKRIATLAALALTACDAASSDGYSFDRKEFDRSQPAITIVVHPSAADLRAKAPPAARQGEGRELMAWSIIRPTGCEVHVVDPDTAWQPEWLGHEVAHCAWGRWHP